MQEESKIVEKAWLAYQTKLLSYIQSRINSPEDAEDILNDVFEKLAKAVVEKVSINHISGWLYRVAKNKIIDYYRTQKNHVPLLDDLLLDDENDSIMRQLSSCMLPMIKALPHHYQQPLLLSEIEGLKYKEVAAMLNLSVPAVKSRVLRGREKLHKSMVSCCIIHHNKLGDTIDYEQKSSQSCSSC
ncbi:MAG: sigma-70 family RNA polymerase sigma factor [Arenicellales bacterium]